MEPLKGQDLLDLVKAHPTATKGELAKLAGYVTLKKDGKERRNLTALFEALLEARGIAVGEGSKKTPGRRLSFITSVQFNGNLLVGSAYVGKFGGQPGDQYKVVLGKKEIRLVPLGGVDDTDEAQPSPCATGNCPMPDTGAADDGFDDEDDDEEE
jgi:hypothetical protein